MHCERCQIEYPEGKKFCRQCGGQLKPKATTLPGEATNCPNCGKSIVPTAKFCGACGTSLVGSTPASSGRIQTTAPPTSKQIDAAALEEAIRQQRKKVLKAAGRGIGGLGLVGVVIAGGFFVYRAFVISPSSNREEISQQAAQGGEAFFNSPEQTKQDPGGKPEKEGDRGKVEQGPDNPPTGTPMDALSLEEKLNRTIPTAAPSTENFCLGDFRVEPIPDPTGQTQTATISFWMNGRELFKEVVRTFDQDSFSTHKFVVIHLQECAGLLRTSQLGPGGSTASSALIVPYQRTFKTIQFDENWADIKDLDGDRIDELLVQKLALGYECVAGAYRQYWTTIYHYDPTQGRLVEVSNQFPQFYATQVKEYQKAFQEIERAGLPSAQCRTKMQNLIAKAQRYTAISGTTHAAAPSLSPGWYKVVRSTPVLEGPRRDAAVITRLSSKTKVYVVEVAGDYVRVESARGKPPGYIARKDIVRTREGKEAAKLEEQRSRKEEWQQHLQTPEEARRQAETARQAEIQRREEERRQREEQRQQQELLRSGERILRGLGH